MSNENAVPLHELRRKNEKKKQNRAEKTIGALIGAGLIALGSWGMWEHNLWIALPFAVVLGIDVFKSFKEKFHIRSITICYTILLVIAMWFHITSTAWIAFGLIAVVYFLNLTEHKE